MNKRAIGSQYEDVAIAYMAQKGYSLVVRNYHCRMGEIDAIFKKDGGYVVCEIKYRRDESCGNPLEAVGYGQQKRICRTTMYFYMKQGLSMDVPCRFDVIGICADGSVTHMENAFEFVE